MTALSRQATTRRARSPEATLLSMVCEAPALQILGIVRYRFSVLDATAHLRYPLPMAENVKKRRPGRSRISAKHQITIPAAAFRGAGLVAGDMVRVEAAGAGRVVLTKVDDLVDQYSGSVATGGELRRRVQALRDEW